MGHDVLDAENVPDRITQGFAVIAVRAGKRHLPECLRRVTHYNLPDLFKHIRPESNQFLNCLAQGHFLRQQDLDLFVHPGPILIHGNPPSLGQGTACTAGIVFSESVLH